ncbi:exosome complex exonuclease rrp40 [Lichtheimia corymbifera JMRC:FSU:9682]|uniref:Ribosomal RNA-processing protein 40 n=1 Tax=Lichtheimia corymbifera JMRC:FSU:9682 TaxID=1263082 RepID=A0A068RJJ4_9FUNG|nr:exosome complex exonuclease rrp40 [Lichtheimia corymbifera JMRC:FSU:9682]
MEVDQASRVVLPGDVIHEATNNEQQGVITLGPGLRQDGEHIVATKAGMLKHAPPMRWWIESNQKRYIAATGESVLGVVTAKLAEYYRVDIGTAHTAVLPALAFEGATKRNKPNLAPRTLVYCRIAMANRDMEAELDCINPTTGKADGFGELKGGYMIKCSLGLCRRLLDANTPILQLLGEHFPFELAVGMNGRVWLNSNSTKDTIMLANAILNSEYLSEEECKAMVQGLINRA